MIAGLLSIGFLLMLAGALSKPARFPRDYGRTGYALGYAGLACWIAAFPALFVRVM